MSHVIEAEQGSDEWLQARVGLATASRYSDIMAKTKSGYGAVRANYRAEIVIERLTDQPYATFSSRAMEWGSETEELARTTYMLKTGNDVTETGLYIHDKLQAGASPDGRIGKYGGLEIKCPNPATHIDTLRSGSIPKKYIAQVQGQMWIVGLKWVDFVSFDPRMPKNAQFFLQRIERDEAFIEQLEQEVISFLAEVETDLEFVKNYKLEKEQHATAKT